MFNESEWAGLVERLLDLTKSGHATWMSNSQNGYYLEVGDVTYVIQSKDRDGVPPYTLDVNQGPSEIDFETLASLSSDPKVVGPAGWLFELYEVAGRSTNNAPKVFKSLMDGLDALDTPF